MNLVLLLIAVVILAVIVDAQWGGYGYNSYGGYGNPYGGYQYGGSGGYNGGYYNGGGGGSYGYGSNVNQQASVLGVSERVGLGLGR